MRRPHALDPPPFLVDENRSVRPADAFAKRCGQRANLFAVADVALEEDEAPGLALTQKRRSSAVSARPEQPQMNAFGIAPPSTARIRLFAYLAMKQSPPSPFTRAHNAAASAFDRPATRKR